jgi:Bacterial nucleoid DNA-binding protein
MTITKEKPILTKTKADLAQAVSLKTSLSAVRAKAVIQATLDEIEEMLARGERLELRDFGVFESKMRRAKVGRDLINQGAKIHIPAKIVVRFSPGKKLKARLSDLSCGKSDKPVDSCNEDFGRRGLNGKTHLSTQ